MMRPSHTEGSANNEDTEPDIYEQLLARNNQNDDDNAGPSNSPASRHKGNNSEPDDELDSEIREQKYENATVSNF
jgi:hypothetical protein